MSSALGWAGRRDAVKRDRERDLGPRNYSIFRPLTVPGAAPYPKQGKAICYLFNPISYFLGVFGAALARIRGGWWLQVNCHWGHQLLHSLHSPPCSHPRRPRNPYPVAVTPCNPVALSGSQPPWCPRCPRCPRCPPGSWCPSPDRPPRRVTHNAPPPAPRP